MTIFVETVCQGAVKHRLHIMKLHRGFLFFSVQCRNAWLDLCLLCYVSTFIYASVPHHIQKNTAPLPHCTEAPPCLPLSVPVCCFTVVCSTLFALEINCLQLGINQVKLNSMSVCLPWSVSSVWGSCGPDSHGAPHAGNPLNLTNSCTNKRPLTTKKHNGLHANFHSVHMTYY